MNNIKNLMMVLFAFGLSYADTYSYKQELLAEAVNYSQNYNKVMNEINKSKYPEADKKKMKKKLNAYRKLAKDYATHIEYSIKHDFASEVSIDINNFDAEQFKNYVQGFLGKKTNHYLNNILQA